MSITLNMIANWNKILAKYLAVNNLMFIGGYNGIRDEFNCMQLDILLFYI